MRTVTDLLAMKRQDLLRVAANLGIRVAGRPSALLINDVLLRQAEVVAREIRPESVRLAALEDGLVRLERANIEQGSMISEMYGALAQLSSEHGVALHSALKTLALKFRTRLKLATVKEGLDRE